jgi:UDP-glucose 4-epimerase
VRVLITGGAGYIGSHTARVLAERGDEVVVLDRLDAGRLAAVAPIEAVNGDLGDRALLDDLFARHRFDAVVHLAGDKSVEASLSDPVLYFANNVGTSIGLVQAMLKAGVRSLVFSSTCAVYGAPSRLPIVEEDRIDPATPYGESKLMVERMLHWFDRCNDLRSVSLRYFNAAGAAPDGRIGEDWLEAVNLVPMVMKAAAGRTNALRVYGNDYPTPDGTAVRDYIHVMDLAEAHVRALDYLQQGGASQILNVGTGRGSSVLEVVAAARRATGRPIPVEHAGRRDGDLAAVWADSSRAHRVLGWQASRDLDDIVESAWRWHSAQLSEASRL